MRTLHRTLASALALLQLLPIAPPLARAVDALPGAISITPVIVERELVPGMRFEDSLTVVNESDRERTFTVSVADFTYDADGDIQFTEEGEAPVSDAAMQAWITPEPRTFTLGPWEARDVAYTVAAPAGATPGGHYGVIFIQTNEQPLAPALAQRIGTLFLVTVPGGEVRGSIRSFTASQGAVGALACDATLENRGTVDAMPEGTITVTDDTGTVVGTYPLQLADPAEKHRVFPGSTRTYSVSTRALPPGAYTATLALETDGFAPSSASASTYVAPVDPPKLMLPGHRITPAERIIGVVNYTNLVRGFLIYVRVFFFPMLP